jgi:hypothetical protein
MFTEIDAAVLAILGGIVMGVLQAIKPFIAEKYTLVALGVFALALGVLLASSVAAESFSSFLIQSVMNAYFIVIAASGPYSIAKSVTKKEENPAGL